MICVSGSSFVLREGNPSVQFKGKQKGKEKDHTVVQTILNTSSCMQQLLHQVFH